MKLDPLSIPYRSVDSVIRLAWVLIFIIIGGQGFGGLGGIAALVAAYFVIMLGYQLLYYQRFEYDLTADSFDIASGVVSRRNREIPIRRIQNVDISRNVLQRLLGIAQINLETAGGSSTEASLKYVNIEEARRLQAEIGRLKRDEATPSATEPAPAEELFAITPKELVLLGIVGIDLRLLSGVGVLLPIAFPWIRSRLSDPVVADPWMILLVSAPVLAAGIIAVTAIISGLLAVANYYDFRLARYGDELQYERGLLQRFSGAIPLEKVQTLTLSENIIARHLGYSSLAVETAGYAPGESGSQSAIPLAVRDRVVNLARSVEQFDDPSFTRPPRRARERYWARYSLVALLIVGVAFTIDRFTGLSFAWYTTFGLLVIPPIAAHLKWVNLGYDVQDDHILLRQGFWTRTITVVPYYRVQTVLDSQTIFQRRRHLATLVVDTAGTSGLTRRQPKALDIDATVATELRREVADRLQTALDRRRADRRRNRIQSMQPSPQNHGGGTPS